MRFEDYGDRNAMRTKPLAKLVYIDFDSWGAGDLQGAKHNIKYRQNSVCSNAVTMGFNKNSRNGLRSGLPGGKPVEIEGSPGRGLPPTPPGPVSAGKRHKL